MHGKMTIIAVAYRLSTIRETDCIEYIEDSSIKEMGTNDELIQKSGGPEYRDDNAAPSLTVDQLPVMGSTKVNLMFIKKGFLWNHLISMKPMLILWAQL